MIEKMGMESSLGQTAEFIKENGAKASKMEKASSLMKMANSEEESGSKAKELNGLKMGI